MVKKKNWQNKTTPNESLTSSRPTKGINAPLLPYLTQTEAIAIKAKEAKQTFLLNDMTI